MKVYVVISSNLDSEVVDNVFRHKGDAENYINLMNETTNEGWYYFEKEVK